MRIYSGLLAGFSFALSVAQMTPPGRTDSEVLAQLARQSAAYRDSLPSFNCEEDVVAATSHGGKTDWRVNFTATLRVLRDPATDQLQETYAMTSYLGKALAEGSRPPLPFYVQGGFGKGVPSFFAAARQACYRYTISGNQVALAGVAGEAPCNDVHSTEGFALLDADGHITHGETRLPSKEAAKFGLTTFASVDYGTILLDGRQYRLPVHLYAENRDRKKLYTFDAHYRNCKLFHATVTIRPGPHGVE